MASQWHIYGTNASGAASRRVRWGWGGSGDHGCQLPVGGDGAGYVPDCDVGPASGGVVDDVADGMRLNGWLILGGMRRMRNVLIGWAVSTAVGVGVLALPDTGPRLFSLSRDHGPSLMDSAGIVLILAGWLPVVWLLWMGRRQVRGRYRRVALGLMIVSGITLPVAIGFDLGMSWVAPVMGLLAAQLIALASVARSADSPYRRYALPPGDTAGNG